MTLTPAQLQALVLGLPWQRLGDAGVSWSHWSTRCRPSCCVTACCTPTIKCSEMRRASLSGSGPSQTKPDERRRLLLAKADWHS
jgi:hypothetical protein